MLPTRPILQFCALLLTAGLSDGAQEFSYDGEHGPSHWGDDYHTCVGKHQSPINIEEHDVRDTTLPPLIFGGLDIPRSSFFTNNGHTVMLKTNESEAATVTGGPLGNSTYVFEQLHFHWGQNDTEGSEGLINNQSFAMELHAVFWKKDYGSMVEATKHPDGLTVLAYFYDTCYKPNPTYKEIVHILPDLESVGTNSRSLEPLLLGKLLVPKLSSMQNYYTYNGSLTTPPCSEVVTWVDFKEPQLLSREQLAAFRDIRATDGHKLTHNFRPVQPLEDRIVYHNVIGTDVNQQMNPTEHAGSHAMQIGVNSSLFIIVVVLLFGTP